MPRAVEIRVDPITKGVIIDTNFPNREVHGATWEPRLFRLGWDSASKIWEAIEATVPAGSGDKHQGCFDCELIQLVDSNGPLIVAREVSSGFIRDALIAFVASNQIFSLSSDGPAWATPYVDALLTGVEIHATGGAH